MRFETTGLEPGNQNEPHSNISARSVSATKLGDSAGGLGVGGERSAARSPARRETAKRALSDHRIALKGWKGNLKESAILDLDGNDVASVLAPRAEGGVVTLAQPARPFVIKPREPQPVTLAEKHETVLPAALVATEAGSFLSAVLCGFVGATILSAITERAKVGAV